MEINNFLLKDFGLWVFWYDVSDSFYNVHFLSPFSSLSIICHSNADYFLPCRALLSSFLLEIEFHYAALTGLEPIM